MWFWITVFFILLIGTIIKSLSGNSSNETSPEEKNRLKDEHIAKFFTSKVLVDPRDSINEDGIRSLRLNILNDTTASLVTDDFTKNQSITLSRVAGNSFSFVQLYTTIGNSEIVLLFLSFSFAAGTYGISCISANDTTLIGKGVTIYFLFEDKAALNYTFEYPPQPWQNSFMNHTPISEVELKTFTEKKLDRWRIDKPDGTICVGDLTKNIEYYDKSEVQFTIRNMAKAVIIAKHQFMMRN